MFFTGTTPAPSAPTGSSGGCEQGEYWDSKTGTCPRLPGAGPPPACSGHGCPPGSPGTPGWKPTEGAGCVGPFFKGIDHMCFKDGDCCEEEGSEIFCNKQNSRCDEMAIGAGCCEYD